jgi:enoyl-CoA hydratase/carnithine racemase
VNRVLPHDELLPAVRAYVEDLAANCSPASMAIMKRQIWQHWTARLDAAEQEAVGLMLESFGRPDFKEGVVSFLQKRPPRFPRVGG